MGFPIQLAQPATAGMSFVPFGAPCQFNGRNLSPVAIVQDGNIIDFDASVLPVEARELSAMDIIPQTRVAQEVLSHSGFNVAAPSSAFATGGQVSLFEKSAHAGQAAVDKILVSPELIPQALDTLDAIKKLLKGEQPAEPECDEGLAESIRDYILEGINYTKSIEAKPGDAMAYLAQTFAPFALWDTMAFLITQEGFITGNLNGSTGLEQAARSAFVYAKDHGIPNAVAFFNGVDTDTFQFDPEKLEAFVRNRSYKETLDFWAAARSNRMK